MQAETNRGCPLRTLTELTLPSGEIVTSTTTAPPSPIALARGGTAGSIRLIRFWLATLSSLRFGSSPANAALSARKTNNNCRNMASNVPRRCHTLTQSASPAQTPPPPPIPHSPPPFALLESFGPRPPILIFPALSPLLRSGPPDIHPTPSKSIPRQSQPARQSR